VAGKRAANYYILRKSKLLRNFDKTANIVKEVFVSRYGADLAEDILKDARREYEALIPRLPYIGGNVPALRTFLIISAWELAVYCAMKKHGKTVKEAWEMCNEALTVRLKKVSMPVRYLLNLYFFSNFVKKRARKIAERTQTHPLGVFAFNFVEGDGKHFDWGVDYTGCSIYKFMCDQDAKEFAPYVCLSDIALSDTFGWGLIRTMTLAEGFDRCDFRFKKGGDTRIASTVWQTEKTSRV
jgi:hypothetical protein